MQSCAYRKNQKEAYNGGESGFLYSFCESYPQSAVYSCVFDGDGKLFDPNPDGSYKTEGAWEQLILKYLYR